MDELEQQLNGIGFKTSRIPDQKILVIEGYVIEVGPHASKRVRVGVSAGDFPFTPPAGIHVSPKLRVFRGKSSTDSGSKASSDSDAKPSTFWGLIGMVG